MTDLRSKNTMNSFVESPHFWRLSEDRPSICLLGIEVIHIRWAWNKCVNYYVFFVVTHLFTVLYCRRYIIFINRITREVELIKNRNCRRHSWKTDRCLQNFNHVFCCNLLRKTCKCSIKHICKSDCNVPLYWSVTEPFLYVIIDVLSIIKTLFKEKSVYEATLPHLECLNFWKSKPEILY